MVKYRSPDPSCSKSTLPFYGIPGCRRRYVRPQWLWRRRTRKTRSPETNNAAVPPSKYESHTPGYASAARRRGWHRPRRGVPRYLAAERSFTSSLIARTWQRDERDGFYEWYERDEWYEWNWDGYAEWVERIATRGACYSMGWWLACWRSCGRCELDISHLRLTEPCSSYHPRFTFDFLAYHTKWVPVVSAKSRTAARTSADPSIKFEASHYEGKAWRCQAGFAQSIFRKSPPLMNETLFEVGCCVYLTPHYSTSFHLKSDALLQVPTPTKERQRRGSGSSLSSIWKTVKGKIGAPSQGTLAPGPPVRPPSSAALRQISSNLGRDRDLGGASSSQLTLPPPSSNSLAPLSLPAPPVTTAANNTATNSLRFPGSALEPPTPTTNESSEVSESAMESSPGSMGRPRTLSASSVSVFPSSCN